MNSKIYLGQQHPDMENRNLDQYWIFWAREAASKGASHGSRIMQGMRQIFSVNQKVV